MTDIVERLRSRIKWDTCVPAGMIMEDAAQAIEGLRQQLSELEDDEQKAVERCVIAEQRLPECQAREKVLRDALKQISSDYESSDYLGDRYCAKQALALPSDSTALDTLLRQAKREEREAAAKEAQCLEQ